MLGRAEIDVHDRRRGRVAARVFLAELELNGPRARDPAQPHPAIIQVKVLDQPRVRQGEARQDLRLHQEAALVLKFRIFWDRSFRHDRKSHAAGRECNMNRLPNCWGLSLARTGMTSLCAALKVLGYDPVEQDPSFERLREIHAAAGGTVMLSFKYLDFVFPGSKFILTTRDVESWLRSMERSQQKNPRPIEGRHERIFRRMSLYDTVGFDAVRLSGAFERHRAELRRYFADRPTDLLELDIAGGDGWERLCPFLGVPTPTAAFPALNPAGRRSRRRLRSDGNRSRLAAAPAAGPRRATPHSPMMCCRAAPRQASALRAPRRRRR